MARDKIVSGIDIGSSKITTLIATIEEDETARIIGVSTVDSKGLRKGQIVNIEEATSAISQSLDAAERMAGTSVAKAYLSVGGAHIASLNSHGVVAIAEPDGEISHHDVERVIDAAKAISLPSSREILHILPRGYSVDGQEGIVDPVNMTGVRLEVDTHLITGGSIAIKNLFKCVEELGVEVSGLVFGGLASSYAVLSDTEKELGVIVVDIGGGTTDVTIYIEGAVAYSSVIPVGAINITKDIAAGLRMSLESGEKVKLALGQEPKFAVSTDDEEKEKLHKTEKSDEMDIRNLHLPEEFTTISKKTLIEGIIKPRLNEIFSLVGLEIKKSGFGGMTPSGLVITGGGALTVGAVESARRSLATSVHIGYPKMISGLIDEITTPAYAASVGLILYGAKEEKNEKQGNRWEKFGEKIPGKSAAAKVIGLIKSLLP